MNYDRAWIQFRTFNWTFLLITNPIDILSLVLNSFKISCATVSLTPGSKATSTCLTQITLLPPTCHTPNHVIPLHKQTPNALTQPQTSEQPTRTQTTTRLVISDGGPVNQFLKNNTYSIINIQVVIWVSGYDLVFMDTDVQRNTVQSFSILSLT